MVTNRERGKGLELGLYVITAADAGGGWGHLDVVRAALAGGADAVQLRDKEVGGAELYRLALEALELVRGSGGGRLFLVNDRVDVALAAGADGVHLGQEDLPASAARRILGAGAVLGVSASSVEEALAAEREGADYLGVGPVFPTPSKPDAGGPLGLEGLRAIRNAVGLPLVAIGGINEDNLEEVFAAGADGIAVISAVTSARDMEEAVRRLRRAVDACRA
ncbi:thiamine phosphate synthase [Candidatus Solincola tengchongensis]|uniref:thiamine phosphate synthase n=1 Tax=Candidatus Solincola tengchongensis TaxID=2900693 RepID=UPI0025811720|nr:thiamine phosphate synthase [Candidatus Solincola tengchongensis]